MNETGEGGGAGDQFSGELRFERRRALVFSDVVGSTPYFARFGDEAGRQLQQRHVDLLNAAIGTDNLFHREQGGKVTLRLRKAD